MATSRGDRERRDILTLNLDQEETDGVHRRRRVSLFQRGLLHRAIHDHVGDADDFVDSGSPLPFDERRRSLDSGVRAVNEKAKTVLEQLLKDLSSLDMAGIERQTSVGGDESCWCEADDDGGSRDLAQRVADLEDDLKATKEEMARREATWTRKEIDWHVKEATWESMERERDELAEKSEELQAAVKELRGEKRRMERLVDVLESMNVQLQEKLAASSTLTAQKNS